MLSLKILKIFVISEYILLLARYIFLPFKIVPSPFYGIDCAAPKNIHLHHRLYFPIFFVKRALLINTLVVHSLGIICKTRAPTIKYRRLKKSQRYDNKGC